MTKRFSLCCFLILLFAACGSSASNEEILPTLETGEKLVVAWVQDGDLLLWRSGDGVQRLATGGVSEVFIAPNGKHLAYTHGENMPETLWIINDDGSGKWQVVSANMIRQVIWLNDEVLYFNTFERFEPAELVIRPADDLHSLDITTREMISYEAGGDFSISPEGDYIAVVTAGAYGESAGNIRAFALSEDTAPLDLLGFPAIATGSHYAFYPSIQWGDATTLLVAIPDADAIYNQYTADKAPTSLWRFDLSSGVGEQIGTSHNNFFGMPNWSNDGERMVYLRNNYDDVTSPPDLYLADGDGTNATVYADDINSVPIWIDGESDFLFMSDGAQWISEPGEPPYRWLDFVDKVPLNPVIVGQFVVFVVVGTDGTGLYYSVLGADEVMANLIAETGVDYPRFDAAWIDSGD